MNTVDAEGREILENAMVARIATASARGRPHVNPLYFVLHGDRIRLGTADTTLAARNVQANPHVQVLFEREDDPDDSRVLRVEGTAEVRATGDIQPSYFRADARKYVLTPRGLWNFLAHVRRWYPMWRHLRGASGGSACVIEVTPTAAEMLVR